MKFTAVSLLQVLAFAGFNAHRRTAAAECKAVKPDGSDIPNVVNGATATCTGTVCQDAIISGCAVVNCQETSVCDGSKIDGAKEVYCTEFACEDAQISTNKAEAEVVCSNDHACYWAKITGFETVKCQGNNACDTATIEAALTVSCSSWYSCQGSVIKNVQSGGSVACHYASACYAAKIGAYDLNPSDFDISCEGQQSCELASIMTSGSVTCSGEGACSGNTQGPTSIEAGCLTCSSSTNSCEEGKCKFRPLGYGEEQNCPVNDDEEVCATDHLCYYNPDGFTNCEMYEALTSSTPDCATSSEIGTLKGILETSQSTLNQCSTSSEIETMKGEIRDLEIKVDDITLKMEEMHAIVTATKEPKRRAH